MYYVCVHTCTCPGSLVKVRRAYLPHCGSWDSVVLRKQVFLCTYLGAGLKCSEVLLSVQVARHERKSVPRSYVTSAWYVARQFACLGPVSLAGRLLHQARSTIHCDSPEPPSQNVTRSLLGRTQEHLYRNKMGAEGQQIVPGYPGLWVSPEHPFW